MSSKAAKAIIAIVIIVMVAPFLFGFISAMVGISGGFGVSVHRMGETIRTDWFNMRVHGVYYVISGDDTFGGELHQTPVGHKRVLVDISLTNSRLDEDLDMDLEVDFFFETRSRDEKVRSINKGGDYTNFWDNNALVGQQITGLNNRQLFVNNFMVSKGTTVRGIIAFDYPENEPFSYFVYEEWEFDGETAVRMKHLYKIRLY